MCRFGNCPLPSFARDFYEQSARLRIIALLTAVRERAAQCDIIIISALGSLSRDKGSATKKKTSRRGSARSTGDVASDCPLLRCRSRLCRPEKKLIPLGTGDNAAHTSKRAPSYYARENSLLRKEQVFIRDAAPPAAALSRAAGRASSFRCGQQRDLSPIDTALLDFFSRRQEKREASAQSDTLSACLNSSLSRGAEEKNRYLYIYILKIHIGRGERIKSWVYFSRRGKCAGLGSSHVRHFAVSLYAAKSYSIHSPFYSPAYTRGACAVK